MNTIDQWMALLGVRRQRELAKALGRTEARVSTWKKTNRIPPAAVLDLNKLAVERGLDVPPRLLASNEAA